MLLKNLLSLCVTLESLVILLPIIYHYFIKFASQFFPGSLEIASLSDHWYFEIHISLLIYIVI